MFLFLIKIHNYRNAVIIVLKGKAPYESVYHKLFQPPLNSHSMCAYGNLYIIFNHGLGLLLTPVEASFFIKRLVRLTVIRTLANFLKYLSPVALVVPFEHWELTSRHCYFLFVIANNNTLLLKSKKDVI